MELSYDTIDDLSDTAFGSFLSIDTKYCIQNLPLVVLQSILSKDISFVQ